MPSLKELVAKGEASATPVKETSLADLVKSGQASAKPEPEDRGAGHAFLLHGAQGVLLNRGDELAGWLADRLGFGGERVKPGSALTPEERAQFDTTTAGQILRDKLREDEDAAFKQHKVASVFGSAMGG